MLSKIIILIRLPDKSWIIFAALIPNKKLELLR